MADRLPAWSVWLLLALPLLLPLGRAAELPLLVGAAVALAWQVRGRLALPPPAWRVALAGFAAFWLAQAVSAPDAWSPERVLRESLLDLRYLPWLAFALAVLADAGRARRVLAGLAAIVALWTADGLLQAASGFSLGGPATADRLSGVFGADDLKLGPALAAFAPFLLLPLSRWYRWPGLVAGGLAVGLVVLLAGARAGWISYALVLGWLLWRQASGGWRGVGVLLLASTLSLAAVWFAASLSPRFEARLARTAALLEADRGGLDTALTGRPAIWAVALRMFLAHPVNGVGVRGFREAYVAHTPPDDPWLHSGEGIPHHPHQLVLELLAETGLIGLLLWLGAALLALRAWLHADQAARTRAAPAGLALVACLFPLNTHFASYSSAWSLLLFLLLGLYAGLLGTRPAQP